jgi:hypothetical protein
VDRCQWDGGSRTLRSVPARLPTIADDRDEDVSPRAEWVWYVVAAVSYIAAGSTHKALLTWLIGPAWVVITLWFGPIAVDAVAATLGVRYRRPR